MLLVPVPQGEADMARRKYTKRKGTMRKHTCYSTDTPTLSSSICSPTLIKASLKTEKHLMLQLPPYAATYRSSSRLRHALRRDTRSIKKEDGGK